MKDENLVEIVSIHEIAAILREDIEKVSLDVKELMENKNHKDRADIEETKANIMLAYRHLEDARMRLGKVIQAQDGGESIYQK